MRELLLLGHILFAMVWIGSHLLLVALGWRARRNGPAALVRFVADSRWLGTRLQGPAAFLVLIFGVLLVTEAGFEYTELWIVAGLVGFAVLLVITATYLLPEYREILALTEKYGVEAPDAQARIRRLIRVARIDSVVMLLVVLDMIAKPGL